MKQKQQFMQSLSENLFINKTVKEVTELDALTSHSWNKLRNGSLILFILLFLTVATAEAQMHLGLKLGANASTQSGIGNIGDDNALITGLNAGVIAKYDFNDWLAIKTGIEYQGKGKKFDSKLLNTKVENQLQYLILPVKAEFSASEKAGLKNGNRIFFATGPYFGYLFDAKQKQHNITDDLTGLNDFDFGWSYELGFEFPVLKSNTIQLSLNYDMGVEKIAENASVQNKSASINLGFIF